MKQTLTGYIRQHLDEIETQIEYGIRHQDIVQTLNAQGYSTTVKTFRTTLDRARAWRKGKALANSSSPPLPAAPPVKHKPAGFDYSGSPDDNELSELI